MKPTSAWKDAEMPYQTIDVWEAFRNAKAELAKANMLIAEIKKEIEAYKDGYMDGGCNLYAFNAPDVED